jgi:linoleoyl-CoA desaturase
MKSTMLLKSDQIAFETKIGQIYKKYSSIDPVLAKKNLREKKIILGLFLIALSLLNFAVIMNTTLGYFLVWTLLGVLMYIVGTRVMHGCVHGSGTTDKKLNKKIGAIALFLCTGSVIWKVNKNTETQKNSLDIRAIFWEIQHNILHHSLPNIHGHDPDINGVNVVRMHKEENWRWWHIFQIFYIWFIYMIMTIYWVFFKDYIQYHTFSNQKKNKKYFFKGSLLSLIVAKIIHACIWIVIPSIMIGSFESVILGFLVMHVCVGLVLALTFQLGHRTENTVTMMPAEPNNPRGDIQYFEWQLLTTSNFATDSKFVNWFTGELSHQVEHHLFPDIDPSYYGQISKEVRKVTGEFGIPYNTQNLRKAIVSHIVLIFKLGKRPQPSLN